MTGYPSSASGISLVNSHYTLLSSAKKEIEDFFSRDLKASEIQRAVRETVDCSMLIFKECLSDGVYSPECVEQMKEIFGRIGEYEMRNGEGCLGVGDHFNDFCKLSKYAASNGYNKIGVMDYLKEVGKPIKKVYRDSFGIE